MFAGALAAPWPAISAQIGKISRPVWGYAWDLRLRLESVSGEFHCCQPGVRRVSAHARPIHPPSGSLGLTDPFPPVSLTGRTPGIRQAIGSMWPSSTVGNLSVH